MFNRLLIGAAVGVAALVLAGCGGEDGDGDDTTTTVSTTTDDSSGVDPQDDPVAYFEAITDATTDVGSYRFDMTMDGVGGVTMEGTALIVMDGDVPTTRMVMETQMSDFTSDSADADMVEITTITSADRVYMQYPPEAGLNEEGQWVTIDLDGELAAMFGDAAQTDVVNTEWLAALGDDLELSVADGDEVDGVATQVVSMTLTQEHLAAADNPLGEAGFEMVGGEMDYSMTVGEDMLVREISIVAGDMMNMAATMYDFGVDETIEFPADEDTVSFEDLMGGMIPDPEDMG